jgi:uncharacterized delta-60 repeat protein
LSPDADAPAAPVDFGDNGLAVFQAKGLRIGGDNDAGAIAVQPDGKILVGGYAETTLAEDFAVVRYNTDGSLDTSFGDNGVFSYSFNNEDYDRISTITLQSDGKILLTGYAVDPATGDSPFTVVRILSNGVLDSSFGSAGLVRLYFGTFTDQTSEAIAFQSDGKIIAGGTLRDGGQLKVVVARFAPNGAVDSSFANNVGYALIDASGSNNGLSALKVTSTDQIVIAGNTTGPGSWDTMVARLSPEGVLDATFGTGGIYKSDLGTGGRDSAADFVVLADQSLMITGYHDTAGLYTANIYLLKLTTSGTLDTAFNGTGLVSTNTGSNGEYAQNIYEVAGGYFVTGADGGKALTLKYTTAGSLDTTFNATGFILTDPTSFYDSINGSAYFNNEIYFVGYIYDATEDFLTFKLKSDGALDTSFQGTGYVITDIMTERENEVVDSVRLANDQKLVISKLFGNNDTLLAITRLNPDGTIDSSYGTQGSLFIGTVDLNYVEPRSIRLLSSGKVLIAGDVDDDFLFIRLTQDGQLDTSFKGGGIHRIADPGFTETLYDVIELADGNYMGVGQRNSDVAIIKFADTGEVVTAFGTNGIATATVAGNDFGATIHELSDRKLIISAQMSGKASLMRLNIDGSLDTSFGGTGYIQHQYNGVSSEWVKGLKVLSDGSYLMAGTTSFNGDSDLYLMKVLSDGSLDPDFGTAGKVAFDPESGQYKTLGDFEVLPDGKILVVGDIKRSFVRSSLLIRFNSDGSLDTSFGTSGIREFEILANTSDVAKGLYVDAANYIWVTGYSSFQLGHSAISKFDSSGNRVR